MECPISDLATSLTIIVAVVSFVFWMESKILKD